MSDKITLKDALEEIVPALMAAGLTEADIRAISTETQRRMGLGGRPVEWLRAWGEVVADTGNERALRAMTPAIDVLAKGRQ